MPSKKQKTDSDERNSLLKSAANASQNAQRVSQALGLSIQIISENRLLEKHPDGSIKEIKKISKIPSLKSGLKKGSKICLK